MRSFLIYGANGYTGQLIAREAARRGLRPIVAGRNRPAIERLAKELTLDARVFRLDEPHLSAAFEDYAAVLNCAGPFSRTAAPLAAACLRVGSHYVDITGEVAVFEGLMRRNQEAQAAGVMLLPGAGFDVVPSDCLAAHLKRRLPTATKLVLAFHAGTRPSRGTLLTMLENLDGRGLVRKNGGLVEVPAGWKTRTIDFGRRPRKAVTIPWGDLATAHFSTGIPDIEVYAALPFKERLAIRTSRFLGPVLRQGFVRRSLENRIRAATPGPSEAERARSTSFLWGEASDEFGNQATARLRGPDGYSFTAQAAVTIVERILAGDAPPGYQTPSTAYGADFVLQIPGVKRSDESGQ